MLNILIVKQTRDWFIVNRFRARQAAVMWLHTTLRLPIAYGLVHLGLLLRLGGVKIFGLKLVLKGRRTANVPLANFLIRKIIHEEHNNSSELRQLLGGGPSWPIENAANRLLILKLPVIIHGDVREKGAIILKFSEVFAPIYLSLNVRLLSKYFRIILEPSWAGYSLEEILVWTTLDPEKVIVLSPEENDFKFLQNLGSNLVPIGLGPADWVPPKTFHHIADTKKIYDSICVANFNPIKRVDRFIRAIVQINRINKDYHAALVCADHGNARREVLATLDWSRNKANITFFGSMDQVSLNKLLNQSKVNALISLKEGANKGLAEGFFSGTPALLATETVGGNRAHINDQTGMVVPDSALEEKLIWFSEHHHEFHPHIWANAHITPTASTILLSKKLQEIETSEGRAWSKDLLPKVNQPELAYLHPEDYWLLPKRTELLRMFSNTADEEVVVKFLEQLK